LPRDRRLPRLGLQAGPHRQRHQHQDGRGQGRQRQAAGERQLRRHHLPLPAGAEACRRRGRGAQMNRLLRSALVTVLFAAACGSPPPPPRRAVAAAAPAPKPMEEEVKEIAPTNIYVYSPIGTRDPFQNQVVTITGITHIEVKGRNKTPLEKWSLDQLKL